MRIAFATTQQWSWGAIERPADGSRAWRFARFYVSYKGRDRPVSVLGADTPRDAK